MIRAVTFDVWETMIRDNAALSEVRSALRVQRMADVLRQDGLDVDQPALHKAYEESWSRMEAVWVTGHEVDTPEQVEMVLRGVDPALIDRLGRDGRQALAEAYVDPIHDVPPLLAPGLPQVLELLHGDGLALGLICNTGRTPGYAMRRLLGDRYQVLQHFDAVAFSNEEDLRKPDPAIFLVVLNKLGVAADQAVHVGDDLNADILGAKRAGLRAVLIRDRYPDNPPARPDAYIRSLEDLSDALRTLDR